MDINEVVGKVKEGATQVEAQVLAYKRTPVTLNVLMIIVLVVILVGGTWYCTSQVYDYQNKIKEAQILEQKTKEELAKVEDSNKIRIDSMEIFLKGVAANQQAIVALIKSQAELVKQTAVRNQTAVQLTTEVTADTRTKEQTLEDLSHHLNIQAKLVNSEYILAQPDIKNIVAVEIERKRLSGNMADTEKRLTLEEEKVKELTAELDRAVTVIKDNRQTIEDYQHLVVSYQTTMNAYKVAAVKSRWQKTKDVLIKIGTIGLIGVIAGIAAR